MKEKCRGKLIVLLVALVFTFLFYSNTAIAQYYDNVSGSSYPYLFIPDATEFSCGNWVYDGIYFSGISDRAYITSVDVTFTINHTFLKDLAVDLMHPDGTEFRLWNYDGTQSPYTRTGITAFNNRPLLGTWLLWVIDCTTQDSGYLESWSLKVNYTIPPPSAPTGLFVTGTGDGEVSLSWNANPETDCNGYFVQWDTLPTVSKTSYIAWVWLEGRFNTNWTVNPSPYGLFNGKPYYFVVTATDDYNNESSESNKVSGTPRESTIPDDPYSTWVPAHYSNYDNENRSTSVIDTIVIHVAEGSYQSAISWFQQYHTPPEFGPTSAHYVVSKYGEITQMVHHNDRAFHAVGHNYRSIGVEHEGWRDDPAFPTTAMYQASANLVRYLCNTLGILKDRSHIIGHNEVPGSVKDDPCCSDPNTCCYWNWDLYMSYITANCTAKAGDANGDGDVNLLDIIFLTNFLFKSGPAPSPYCRGDATGDGNVLLPDIVYLINYVFKAGSAPVKSDVCCL